MSGIFHKFYLSTEQDINHEIEVMVEYEQFAATHEKVFVDDNFIQILLISKCLLNVPSYRYDNKILSCSINPLAATVFRNNQLPVFLEYLGVFENMIDSEKIKAKMKYYKISKKNVLKELNKLRDIVKKGIDTNLCVYHIGL